MENIKSTVFNPLLGNDRQKIVEFLLSLENTGICHPWNGKLLLVDANKCIIEIDISDKPDSFFLDAVSLNDMAQIIQDRMALHSDSLAQCLNYSVISLTDSIVEIPLPTPTRTDFNATAPEQKDLLLFALSVSNDPSYYDLCLASGPALGTENHSSTILCYNHYCAGADISCFAGFRHSGDIVRSGGVLLHSIRCTAPQSLEEEGIPFVVFVSGYSRQPLHKYKKQRPAVLLANHATKSLYLIPVPLDEATIGQGTICCPVVVQRTFNERNLPVFRICVLARPPTVDNCSAGGGTLVGGQAAFDMAVQAAQEMIISAKATRKAQFGEEKKPKDVAENIEKKDSSLVADKALEAGPIAEKHQLVLLAEEGVCINPRDFKPTFSIYFSNRLSLTCATPSMDKNVDLRATILPICFGQVLHGPFLLALGKDVRVDPGAKVPSFLELSKLYQSCTAVLCVISDRMLDTARLLNPHLRINGLVILQPLMGALKMDPGVLDDFKKRQEWMEVIGGNCVTAIAGPCAIVVVQILENYFFYRGVCWPSFFEDEMPHFGADVTDQVFAFQSWCEKRHQLGSRFDWPILVDLKVDRHVYFHGNKYAVNDVSQIFDSLSFEDILKYKQGIRDVLTQLSVILDVEEIKTVVAELTEYLKKKISLKTEPYLKDLISFLTSARNGSRSLEMEREFVLEKNSLNAKLKASERECHVCVQWLVDDLGNLVSSRTSSNKKHDLKQIMRQQKITANLDAAKDMTRESFTEILNTHCSELGVVMGNVQEQELKRMLPLVASSSLLNSITQHLVSSVDQPVSLRSGVEMGILMEHAQHVHTGPLQPAGGVTMSLTLPQGYDESRLKSSAIPWALYDEFVQLKSPAQVFWIEKANEAHIATLRIALRATLTNAQVSRSYGVSPSAPDLGFLLVLLLTDCMKNYADAFTAVPDSKDFNTDGCKIMRGLFGQLLCILASGQYKPLSNAFQVIQSNPKLETPPLNQWWIYSRVVSLFPYTGWSRENINRHAAMILAKMIRNAVVDPVCGPMRESIAEMESNHLQNSLKFRNQQLMFLKIAVHVVRYIEKKNLSDDEAKELAAQILHFKPLDTPEGGGYQIVLRYLTRLRDMGSTSLAERNNVIKTCHDIFSKRSAQHKVSKNRIVESLDSNSSKSAEDLAQKSVERSELVSDYFLETEAHDQGIEMLKRLAKELATQGYVDIDMINRVKSDAERNRTPWRVGPFADGSSDVVNEKDIINMLKCIHSGAMFKPKERPRPDGTSNAVVQSEKVEALTRVEKLLKVLLNVPKNQKAVELVRNIDNVTLSGLFSHISLGGSLDTTSLLRELTTFLGMMDDICVNERTREVLEAYLEEWRDPVAGDQKAASIYLKHI